MQVLQEVGRLNKACSSAVLVLERQLLDIKKLIQERRMRIERNAAFEGDHSGHMQKSDSDPDMKALKKEQRSIDRRWALFLLPFSCPFFSLLSLLLLGIVL